MHSDCELLVVCKIRHNHVYSSQSSFDELFNMIAYEDFTLLVNCINTTVTAEQSLHHNIILEKQDHCTVSRVNTKTAISRSHTSVQTSTYTQNDRISFRSVCVPNTNIHVLTHIRRTIDVHIRSILFSFFVRSEHKLLRFTTYTQNDRRSHTIDLNFVLCAFRTRLVCVNSFTLNDR